jgi:energy-coupling factor transporter ATP-binding protein EcfA2
MRLKLIKYSEWVGQPQEWVLEGLALGTKNLLVGKNASGKSRSLNVINSLAALIAGLRGPTMSGTYECVFEHQDTTYLYYLQSADQQVVAEKLRVNDKTMLERAEGGVGEIWADQVDGGSTMKFQTPTKEISVFARRDLIQHPFLEPLYEWATSVRHHQFGTNMGKDSFAVFQPGAPKVNDRDQNLVVGVFRDAEREFKNRFIDSLKSDMDAVGYAIEHFELGAAVSAVLPSEFVGLRVKERDLPGLTDQIGMSQGMYRVLSLLIYVNYFQLKNIASCVIVDDVGEGLDFDRSCRLIHLLRRKTDEFNLQIILATNDRFIMNEVPLEEWSFLQRQGNHVRIRNIENSRAIFESFKFTGLSNFSFLELDVLGEADNEKTADA